MLLIQLNENSNNPLYKQISDEIKHKIEDNLLNENELLPSSRCLASALGVNRSTVSLAYETLWSLGYIDMKQGQRPKVRKRVEIAKLQIKSKSSSINWNKILPIKNERIKESYDLFYKENSFSSMDQINDLSSMTIDMDLFPITLLKTSLNTAFNKLGKKLFKYGDEKGYLPLRKFIVHRLQIHGIYAAEEEIMITHGSQQAINLILSMFSHSNKTIAVEAPTYADILPLLRFYNIKIIEIPMKSDGMDLEILESHINNSEIDIIYTMPNFQNPSGITSSQNHREALLKLCEMHQIPIIEDAFEEEMKYFGKPVFPIKSMDKNNIVFYCGTFSKVLFPGFRIGWIAADKQCIESMSSLRWFEEMSLNTLTQAALHDFCEKGHYDRHVNKMNRIYKKRMTTALNALSQYVSNRWAEWSKPLGGFLIWLSLKQCNFTYNDLLKIFKDQNVMVRFGNDFFATTKKNKLFIRLSIASIDEEKIINGIKQLGNSLKKIFNTH